MSDTALIKLFARLGSPVLARHHVMGKGNPHLRDVEEPKPFVWIAHLVR